MKVPASPSAPSRRPRARRGLLVLLTAASLMGSTAIGCWTSSGQGDEMARRIEDHQRRLVGLEKGISKEREQLREQLDETSRILKRNSADVGARVDEMDGRIAKLTGSIEELQHSLETMDQQLAQTRQDVARALEKIARGTPAAAADAGTGTPAIDPSSIPADRDEHFAAATRAFQARDFATAVGLFRAYVERYPNDDHADNAQYYVGSAQLSQGRPAAALGELQRVLDRWPRGDAVDEALLDMGESFFRLGSCSDARTTLDLLVNRYPDSPLAARARARRAEIQRAPRTQCTTR